jgi:FKBP-type peptidyl-prolyl cis-trans isomerase 2
LIVEPAEGYGEPRPELLVKAPRDSFSHLHDFHVGAVISGRNPDGPFRGVVREIGETEITIDLNHPLSS